MVLPVPQAAPTTSPHCIHKPWLTAHQSLGSRLRILFKGVFWMAVLNVTGGWQVTRNQFATPAAATAVSLNGLDRVLIFTLRLSHHYILWEYSVHMLNEDAWTVDRKQRMVPLLRSERGMLSKGPLGNLEGGGGGGEWKEQFVLNILDLWMWRDRPSPGPSLGWTMET